MKCYGCQFFGVAVWWRYLLNSRLFSGKTRQLHATHVTTGDRLWSNLPSLRAMATITHNTLAWYGWDQGEVGVHDVIGTRRDPDTNRLLKNTDYHHCCQSNLTRALADHLSKPTCDVEPHIHTECV